MNRTAPRRSTPVKEGGKGFKKGERKTYYEEAGFEVEEVEEDLEEDDEAYGTYLEQQEQEEGRQDLDPIEEEEDQELEEDSLAEEELKEAWAAGWKAKSQQNEKKRYRGWKGGGKGSGGGKPRANATPDKRKVHSTCSSCGEVGHWKGDPQCRNVQSGKDQLHKKKENGTHVVAVAEAPTEEGQDREQRRSHNPECQHLLKKDDKFCLACGIRAPKDESMKEKRSWQVVDLEEGQGIEVSSSGSSEEETKEKKEAKFRVRRSSVLDAAGLPKKEEDSKRMITMTAEEVLAALPGMSKEEKRRLKQSLRSKEEDIAWKTYKASSWGDWQRRERKTIGCNQ